MEEVHRDDERLLRLEARAIGAGVAGGLLAGVAMGIVLDLGTEIMPALGSFLGESTALRGWIVHLVLSILFGVSFAVVVAYPPIADFAGSFGLVEWVLAGITYAVMVGAVTLGVLPFVFELPWQTAGGETPFGQSAAPGIAGVLPGAAFAIAHLVFGAIIGAVYARLGEPGDGT